MANRSEREERRFTIRMQKKLVVLFGIVLLAFVGLSLRLIYINRDNGEQYKKQVLEQQEYTSKTLVARRGDIFDSNGNPLAVSEKIYNLIIDSKVINDKEAYYEPTMAALDKYFDIDMNAVRKWVKENPKSAYYVAAKGLTYNEVEGYLNFMNDETASKNVKGIWFEDNYKRNYPNGTLACDIIGFTNAENNGTYGLEEYYDDVLNGTPGREYGYLDEDENLERTTKPAVDGYSLVTTIDATIQSIVERNLKSFNDTYANRAREGLGANNLGCIIMDVNNGDVLAMASYPNFDLNNPKDLSMYYSQEAIDAFTDEEFYEKLNGLWKNFCISETYEPGSTMKPFTVACGLESGKLTGNESYTCTGAYEVADKRIKCHNYKYGGCGTVNVKQAVEQSCNVALMQMSLTIGKDIFLQYQQSYNFGLKTNIDLAGEARTNAVVYNSSNMRPAELATSSFGQGFNVSMIQMITGFCSLINGGYYYEPHMVKKIVSGSGATIQNIEPRVLRKTISTSTSNTIIDYCNGVVTEGTGKAARPAGYRIGGKTGTAETLPRGNNEYVVSFMGYAPADNPKIAIYVVIDRVNDWVQDNVKLACTLTRDILTETLPYMGIYMTEPISEKEQQELAAKQLEITLAYTAPPEETTETPAEGENTEGTPAEGATGDAAAADPNGGLNLQWKNFPVDPATGYLKDPESGDLIDPDTGQNMSRSDFTAVDG
ncbi:MAG: penicillin-binding protein 2 [Lachnospiraceae bacterium]|nr:penicillin-binding protein 2 [Lachnospiraceae bacterium]